MFDNLMDPIERVLNGPRRIELEKGSVHVVANVNNVERYASVKVPIQAVYGLHVGSHRSYELRGFISSEDLPDGSTRQPVREICVNISVWWNAPAVRRVLKQRLREEREALQRAARNAPSPTSV